MDNSVGENYGYRFHIIERFNKAHYTSIHTASSSPGRRKGTFGTPIGIFYFFNSIKEIQLDYSKT
jgi:hypothetical protein